MKFGEGRAHYDEFGGIVGPVPGRRRGHSWPHHGAAEGEYLDRHAQLRGLERMEQDPDALFRLRRRIEALMPLWREARELAGLTARYYDRSYHKNEKYTL